MRLSRSRTASPTRAAMPSPLRPRRPQSSAAARDGVDIEGFDLDAFLSEATPTLEAELAALQVERRARSDGRQNHPPDDAEDFGAFEDRVVDHVTARFDRVAAEGGGALRRLRRDILDGLAQIRRPEFEQRERDVELALDDRYARIRHDLRDLFKRRLIAERNLNYYRRTHGLDRPARYPESSLFHYGLLIFVIVLESVANAYFFAQASDLGLLGGVVQAAVFSLVNVAWSFGFGLTAYRYLNAAQIGWRALAAVGVLIHLSGVLLINLAIAHYRDVVAISPDGATLGVISRVVETPFGLESFESVLLFMIGALIAGFAVWKGYTADDPTPGYGPADREFTEVDSLCRDTKEELLDQAEDAMDAVKEPISEDLEAFEAQVAEVKDRVAAFRTVAEALMVAEAGHQRVCTGLLKTYREENRAVRSDPPPVHFEDYPTLSLTHDIEDLDDIEGRIRALEDMVETAREDAAESRARLQALHEETRAALEDMFTHEETVGGRLAERSFPTRAPAGRFDGRAGPDGPEPFGEPEPDMGARVPSEARRARRAAADATARSAVMEDDTADRRDPWGGLDNPVSRRPGPRGGAPSESRALRPVDGGSRPRPRPRRSRGGAS